MAPQTPTPTSAPTRTISSSAQVSPVLNFQTPALTTTFTPPASCTAGHLTMLMSAAYQIWLNEPRPVANTTISDCYPTQFVTSYLASASGTFLPAFSPLVCPDNYFTIFNQTVTSRPLYVACCPSNYGFHPPDTSTPGRPGYGGTCYSNIFSQTVTQYDNSSSSGVMLFTTSGQAYAHPIDGFALETTQRLTVVSTETPTTTSNPLAAAATTSSAANRHSRSTSHAGLITGLVVGLGAGLLIAAIFFIFRSRKRKNRNATISSSNASMRQHSRGDPPPWSPGEGAKELPSPPPVVKNDPIKSLRSELSDGTDPARHEMPQLRETPLELDGGYGAHPPGH